MTRVLGVVRRIGWKLPVALIAVGVAATSLWWGPRLLSRLAYFHLRRVEVRGAHYLQPSDVLARMRVDTSTSIWSDTHVLERRVALHPQVRAVEIERKLPGTLVVQVTENLPVAFIPSAGGLRAVDVSGKTLPIDPSRVNVDLPVLAKPDTALLRLLADVRGRSPALFDRISNVRRVGRNEVALALPTVLVRALPDVSAERLADIIPVESDLARRGARATELDLRFRDQVIARLQ
jgi:cell division protein FtsQ